MLQRTDKNDVDGIFLSKRCRFLAHASVNQHRSISEELMVFELQIERFTYFILFVSKFRVHNLHNSNLFVF